MAQFVDGNEVAFTQLYERVAPGLFAKLLRSSRDPELTRDVVQTTFLKVFRARDSYVRGAAVLPWIQVIAKRTLIDEWRPASAKQEVLTSDGSLKEPPLPEQLAEDDLMAVRWAYAELPNHYREAITLTKLSGLTGSEAAAQLRTTTAAIKQRVHRGYELLRKLLEPGADGGMAPVG
jgi:RNA polymerase sigma-70 factor (ECF subfamily)